MTRQHRAWLQIVGAPCPKRTHMGVSGVVNRYIQRAVQIDGVYLFALEAPVVIGAWAFLDDAERVDPQVLETNPAACCNCVEKTSGE